MAKKSDWCPLTKKDCVEHKCAWYTQIRGVNPQTGQDIDDFGCAISWMPVLAIEIAQKSNQTGAAVESFKNEVSKANRENQHLYTNSLNNNIIVAEITSFNQPIKTIEGSQE